MQNSEERTRRMNQQRRRGLIFVLIGLALFIWTIPAQSQNGVVVRVVDGDAVDRYGRLLRYVYLADGKNFNAILIREGYAIATRRFPYPLKREFLALEDQARKARRNIWATAGRSSQ